MDKDTQLLEALIAHQQSVLATNQEQTLLHENWRRDYATLKSTLTSLSGKLEQGALLPLGPKAFAHGKLIHTNEVTCLLGDNWFMECSAKHAIEIVNRRIGKCDDALKKLKQELDQSQAWRLAAGQQLGELMDENVQEIREEYDEEKEKEWRKGHREKVRKYHQEKAKARAEGRGEAEFQDVMSRLDELELQEDQYEYKYERPMPVPPKPKASPLTASASMKKPDPISESGSGDHQQPSTKPSPVPVTSSSSTGPGSAAAAVGATVIERQPTVSASAPVKEKRVSKFKKSRDENLD